MKAPGRQNPYRQAPPKRLLPGTPRSLRTDRGRDLPVPPLSPGAHVGIGHRPRSRIPRIWLQRDPERQPQDRTFRVSRRSAREDRSASRTLLISRRSSSSTSTLWRMASSRRGSAWNRWASLVVPAQHLLGLLRQRRVDLEDGVDPGVPHLILPIRDPVLSGSGGRSSRARRSISVRPLSSPSAVRGVGIPSLRSGSATPGAPTSRCSTTCSRSCAALCFSGYESL